MCVQDFCNILVQKQAVGVVPLFYVGDVPYMYKYRFVLFYCFVQGVVGERMPFYGAFQQFFDIR